MIGGWSPWALLFVGLIVGWAIEWVIDWMYWRRNRVPREQFDHVQAEHTRLKQTHEQVQAELASARRSSGDCANRVRALEADLGQRTQQAAMLEAKNQQFAQLVAALEADHAKAVTEREQLNHELEHLRGSQARLAAAEAELASLRQAPSIAEPQHELITSNEPSNTLADPEPTIEPMIAAPAKPMIEPQPVVAGAVPAKRDPLIDINGIGPVYEQRLFAAGITTFAQLAHLSAPDVLAIIQPKEWQKVDAEAWIAEAALFVERASEHDRKAGQE
jgi:predicted flap endonuclease-1-like 5' DNA nuclease